MPECIVCKGYYEAEQSCGRCGSDNSAWEKWKREEEALGPGGALLRFLEPHFGLPLMIAGWALAFGLLGMLWPWGGVRPPMLVLAITLTFVGCVLAVPDVYEKRFDLREQELLRKIKRGWKKGIGIKIQTLLVPATALSLAMLLTLCMVQSRMLWKLMEWLVLEPEHSITTVEETSEQGEPGFEEKIKRAFPLACLSGYVTLSAFAYSSSLMLAQGYAKRLNRQLPPPIFLQDEKLAQVVRRAAEIELGRIDPKNPTIIDYTGYVKYEEETDPRILRLAPNVDVLTTAAGGGSSPPRVEVWGQAATWIWDELERTEDGGIKMKVARQEVYQLPKQTEKSGLSPGARVSYVVRADPWGHVIEIKRIAAE